MPTWLRPPRTRAERLEAADRARACGRLRAAVRLYREVLAEPPEDPFVQGKLGAVLARLGDFDEAQLAFWRASELHVAAGFPDRALAVTLQAREALPLEPELDAEVARLELQRGRRADAVQALAQGGERLAEDFPEETITLLYIGLSLDSSQVDVLLRLAGLLCSRGRREEARSLLARLPPALDGPTLRRARWVQFRAEPGAGTAWRYLRTLAGGRGGA